MGIRRFLVSTAVLTALAGVFAAPAEEPRRGFDRRELSPSRGLVVESERESKIRRAREEIRKDPSQRKFILFRHGLRDEDLR